MNSRSISSQVFGLAGWLFLTFIAAALGALASMEAGSFYNALTRPSWAPPAEVFGPVWTVLYALMALAMWWVWRRPENTQKAQRIYVIQLVFNVLWSWLFFRWQQGQLASFEVLLLVVLVFLCMMTFWRHSKLAGAMLLPYFLWCLFASALTWWIWLNNPGVL